MMEIVQNESYNSVSVSDLICFLFYGPLGILLADDNSEQED